MNKNVCILLSHLKNPIKQQYVELSLKPSNSCHVTY